MSSFMEQIDQALRSGGDRLAFVEGDRRFTCRDAERRVSAFEQWLLDHCRPGDRVAALTKNRVEAVLLEWATYRAGCIWLGIPARERDPGSLVRLLVDFTPRLLVLERFGSYGEIAFQRDAFPAQEEPPPPGLGAQEFRALWRTEREGETGEGIEFRVGRQAIRRLRYTSGSAGEPKAVAYSDRTLATMLEMIAETVLDEQEWTVVHGLPITWASGSLIAPALHCGGRNVILESWDVDRFIRAVAREERVLSLLTPGLLAALTTYSETHGSGWARGLARVVLAGAPTPVWTMRRAWRLFPGSTEFFVTLGQTEASFPITWHRVTEEDMEDSEKGPAVVPLGRFTRYYGRRSDIDGRSGEIRLTGGAVAPGIWVPKAGRFQALATLRRRHRTGDRALVDDDGVLHYLGRMTDRWRDDPGLPAPDALEVVLNECPGVRRSRVDLLERVGGDIDAEVTVQPMAPSLAEERLVAFFDEHRRDARLGAVSLRRVSIGEVELTLSGKVKRLRSSNGPPAGGGSSPPAAPGGAAPASGGSGSPGPSGSRSWERFDFSRIATRPLYFYVGAGLSMGAGLVSWSEMACLIWAYRKCFEGTEDPPCPEKGGEEIEEYLDEFVSEKIEPDRRCSPPILSREAGEVPEERRTLGRAALLNMLFRYRGPRVRLEPRGGKAVPNPNRLRLRPGEEPSQEDLTIHSMIWRSRCHGVFTTNYDLLLEHAFSLYHHGAALRSYRYTADYLRFILSNPRFVLKLHGDINDITTMEFCPIGAWSGGGLAGDRGTDLERVYHAALDRGHVIYLGCGFTDKTIRRLHKRWKPTEASRRLCRVALLRDAALSKTGSARPARWREIEFLRLGGFSEVKEFMEQVVSVRSGAGGRWSSCPEATDLHRQLFLGWDPIRARRNFSTRPWSCRGEVPPK